MTHLEFDCSDEKALFILKAARLYDEGLRNLPEWIPCSERLPERTDNGAFPFSLVTLDNGDVCLGIRMNDYGDWFARMKEGETVYSEHKVIAWMPLPMPYKKEGAE